MPVKLRQRIAGGNDLGYPRCGADKADERAWHLEYDFAAALNHHWDVAEELQRIPEPLLGVD